MPTFLKPLFLIHILVLSGIGLSFAQSDDCDGTEPLVLNPRPSDSAPAFGDVIFIDIEFTALDDVELMQIPIVYDPLILQYLPNQCNPTGVLEGFTCMDNVINLQPGEIRIFWFHPGGLSNDIFENDPIVTLAFEIIGVSNSQSVTIAQMIDGFEFIVGTTDPDAPNGIGVDDFCQVESILNVTCSGVVPFITPCGGNTPGSASLTLQICGGVPPYSYLLQSSTGQIIENQTIPSDTDAETITGLDPGETFDLVITDSNSDVVFDQTVDIPMEDAMQANIVLDNPFLLPLGGLLCAEGTQSTTALTAEVQPPSTDYVYEWANVTGDIVGSSETASTLGVGMYFLTVTNAVTGCSTTADFNLEAPAPIDVVIDDLSAPGCATPGAQGSITLSVTGGRPEFGQLGQYEVIFRSPNSVTDEVVTSRPDGTVTWPEDNVGFVAGSEWTVIVDDHAGSIVNNTNFSNFCLSEPMTFTVPMGEEFEFDIQDTVAMCADGLADIRFFVSPSPPDPPPVIQDNITIFDENGVEVTLSDNQILRSGDVINDIPPGDYTFIYTNLSDGCPGTGSFTIIDAGALVVDPGSLVPDNPNCGTVASIDLQIDGGTGDYSYNWTDGSTDGPIRTDLIEGIDYFVTITDNGGCGQFINDDAIQVTGSFSFPTQQITGFVDCNQTTGSIIFTPDANDMEDYFIDIGNGPVNGTQIDNLPEDDYMVQLGLVNNPSCISDPIPITLQASAGVDTAPLMIDSLHCGFPTGLISYTALGSDRIALVLFDQAGMEIMRDNSILEDIDPGTYSLSLIDQDDPNACPTDVGSFVIYEQFEVDQTSISNANIIQPTCGGSDFGSLTINVTGGIAPYTFEWNDNVTTNDPTRTDLTQGTPFQVTITDASGQCSDQSGTLTVDQVQGLTIDQDMLDITDVSCDGQLGSISFVPEANDPNTYIIEVNGMQSQPGGAIENLAIDDYDVILSVSGTPGCNVTFTNVPVVASANLNLDNTNVTITPDCNSFLSNIDLDPGAITDDLTLTLFQGNFPSQTAMNALQLTDVAPGTYRLNVDNGICIANINIDVDVAPIDQPRVVNANGPTCMGPGDDGSIELAVSSTNRDFTVDWDDGFSSPDLTRTDLVPGTYSVTITNATQCQTTIDNIELDFELDGSFPAVLQSSAASCRGAADGIIAFEDDGMTEFLWDDGGMGAVRTDLIGDDAYVVTRMVAGNTQCTQDTVIANIDFNDGVVLRPDDVVPAIPACFGGVGTIEIPLGAIQNGTAPFSDFTLEGLGALEGMDFTSADGMFTDVPAGTYRVLFSDASGCQAITPITLDDGDPVVIDPVAAISEPVCQGDANGSRSIEVSGGSTGMFDIEWSSGETEQNVTSSTATTLSSGMQFVTITDQACGAEIIEFMVEEGDSVSILGNQITPTTCFGFSDGVVLVNVLGNPTNFDFAWAQRPGENTNRLTDLEAGIYNLTVTDTSNGCPSSPLEFTVDEPDDIVTTLNEAASVPISCNNEFGTITLDVVGGDGQYDFEWVGFPDLTSNSEGGLDPGFYEINVSDQSGCRDNFINELLSVEDISFRVSDFDPIICAGETTFIGVENIEGGAPPYRFSFREGGNLVDVAEQVEVGADTYIFNVFDVDGCSAFSPPDPVVIDEPEPPLISLGEDTIIDLGVDFNLIPDIVTLIGIDSVNYFSDDQIGISPFGMNGISFTPDNDVTITAELIDEDGCTAMDDIVVSVKRTRNVYIPNVFIPTSDPDLLNDNENAVFNVALGIGAEQVTVLNIYDRWGNLIHEGSNSWDGTSSNNELVNPGVYAYFVSVLFTDGQVLNFSGDVTVIH